MFGEIKFCLCQQIDSLEDLSSNVMEGISSREVNESPTPTIEPEEGEVEPEEGEVEPEEGEAEPEEGGVETEGGEADQASQAKVILDITFKSVRQRLTEQQAHLPSPAIQVP